MDQPTETPPDPQAESFHTWFKAVFCVDLAKLEYENYLRDNQLPLSKRGDTPSWGTADLGTGWIEVMEHLWKSREKAWQRTARLTRDAATRPASGNAQQPRYWWGVDGVHDLYLEPDKPLAAYKGPAALYIDPSVVGADEAAPATDGDPMQINLFPPLDHTCEHQLVVYSRQDEHTINGVCLQCDEKFIHTNLPADEWKTGPVWEGS